jgi:uncharacterized protein (TIGR02594 family)
MSYADVVARVSTLQSLISQATPGAAAPTGFADVLATARRSSSPVAAGGTTAPAGMEQFLQAAGLTSGSLATTTAVGAPAGATGGLRALAVARGELGVSEEPPGSNDGARIATYRTATAGAYAGAPWCAYFVSWCAREAGVPLGENGQGYGAVEQIEAWGRRTGRFVTEPQPGDIVLFGGAHTGLVESVDADGSINTIEGNTSHTVARRHHAASEATGYVRI